MALSGFCRERWRRAGAWTRKRCSCKQPGGHRSRQLAQFYRCMCALGIAAAVAWYLLPVTLQSMKSKMYRQSGLVTSCEKDLRYGLGFAALVLMPCCGIDMRSWQSWLASDDVNVNVNVNVNNLLCECGNTAHAD